MPSIIYLQNHFLSPCHFVWNYLSLSICYPLTTYNYTYFLGTLTIHPHPSAYTSQTNKLTPPPTQTRTTPSLPLLHVKPPPPHPLKPRVHTPLLHLWSQLNSTPFLPTFFVCKHGLREELPNPFTNSTFMSPLYLPFHGCMFRILRTYTGIMPCMKSIMHLSRMGLRHLFNDPWGSILSDLCGCFVINLM